MRLRILGCGSPKPSLRRANSSYLIEVGSDRILFDHGFGAGQRLLEAGLLPQDITHVFLTHHHYDHIGDLPRLLLTGWDQRRIVGPDPEVFGPPPLGSIVEGLLGEAGVYGLDLAARVDSRCSQDLYRVRGGSGRRRLPRPAVTELNAGDRIERPGWTVTTAQAIHCPETLDCLAYRIDAGGRSILYTGDTGPSAQIAALARGCDMLIVMCSQESGRIATPAIAESCLGHLDVAAIAAGSGAATLILTHIEHLENEAVRERSLSDIRRIFPGEVVVAEDLMEFELAPRQPAAQGAA